MRNNAPLPPVPGAAVRNIVQTVHDGQKCENTIDYRTPSSFLPSAADLVAAAAAWITHHSASFLGCLTADTTLFGVLCARLDTLSVPTAFSSGASAPGTVAGHNLPIEMAAVIRKVTGVKGQHGRGRVSLPAVPIGFTTPAADANNINGTGVAAYATFAGVLLSGFVVGVIVYAPALLQRPTPPATIYTLGTVLTGFTPDLLLGTVRRRKLGRGI
jgi:hypothetical protein